jgi:AcrR family transcriptional regulator
MSMTDEPESVGANPPKLNGDQRHHAILAASAVLFDEVGYHNATIALIAERAATSKANVYQHFRMKHDILFAIHEVWIDELLGLARRNMARHADVPDTVRQIFRDLMQVIHDNPSQVRVYFEYFRDLSPDLQNRAAVKRDEYAAYVEGVVRRGIETGVLRDQSPRIAAYGLFGMANWGYQWYRPHGPMSHQQIAEQLSEIYLRGMVA